MIVGAYTLDLYCDHPEHNGFILSSGKMLVLFNGKQVELAHQFVGRTERYCRKQARKAGWVFKRGREVVCPFCTTQTRKEA